MHDIAVLVLLACNLRVDTRTLTQQMKQSSSAVSVCRVFALRSPLPVPPHMCRQRERRSKAVLRWRIVIRLVTFFEGERTAFTQASQSLKFFAARQVHLSPF